MKFLRVEWEKLKPMNFTEKRQYIWEYYKLHIFALLVVAFITGSLMNTFIFNPPSQDYLYFAWIGPPVASFVLDDFADKINKIVENPDRYEVRATNYNLEGVDPHMVIGLQTRFVAQIQRRGLDLFMFTKDELYSFSSNGFVLPIVDFLDELEEINPAVHDILRQRLVEITFYQGENGLLTTDYMAASMHEVSFFDRFNIQTDDLFLAVVINAERFERVARALEVILDV